ncbi:Conjugative transfer protein TrbL [Candidatus Burkholderia pumila]|uniref:Conjugative transfer protein TrbL n=1 Tax=Candidatus Burkholderia pumila TaxID=1090375 RepID=A0ABR5HLB2_9BURK|nr:Conjugative transfer protein TrbL [Candidatus Burkholderia pumila]
MLHLDWLQQTRSGKHCLIRKRTALRRKKKSDVLAIGAELMVMLLLIGIGRTFINEYYASMRAGIDLKEMAIMLIAAFVLMYLTNKVLPRIAGIVGVGGAGSP